MTKKKNKYLRFFLRKSTHSVLFGVFSITLLSWYGTQGILSPTAAVFPSSSLKYASHGAAGDSGTSLAYEGRVYRLQKRLRKAFGRTYDLDALQEAVRERAALLKKSVTVQWQNTEGDEVPPWTVSVGGYPSWVKAQATEGTFGFALSKEQIAAYLTLTPPPGITTPKNSMLTDVKLENGVYRAVVDGDAEAGYALDAQATAETLIALLKTSGTSALLPLSFVPGRIVNASSFDLGPLQFLTTGRSDFAGSGYGRISNVRKGLSELIDNIIVPPGEEFSFNKAVNDMKVPGGWQDALVIVNGKDLVSQPGGGICQVATTVYRAALNWGLPIMQRANHSLFVTYYMKFGVGIDATIYPKQQDLTFINNTGHYLLLQAYSRGFDAYVNLYGQSDGRMVALEGPFFQSTSSAAFQQVNGKALRSNEIGWLQKITFADGFFQTNVILSRYSSVPRYVKEMYAQLQGGNT
ncbi:MAG: VanW family protein [Candidatus Peribacteraceae bacterium]|jgi:hypothetical protein